MVKSAALLVDEVLPWLPMRQWVLSFPFQLRFLFASRPEIMSRVLGIVYRAIDSHLIQQAGCTRADACIEDPALVKRILDHLEQRSESGRTMTPPARAPPGAAERQGTIR